MHVIVAVRGGQRAKHRCAGLLSLEDRVELTSLMLRDLLDAVAGAKSVAGIWVVTWTCEFAPIVEAAGARMIAQAPPSGLNEAFSQAAAAIRAARGDVALALLPADLPSLTGTQLDEAATLAGLHDVVVAPSRGGGTGGLFMKPGIEFAPLFGVDSFRRHIEAARSMRLDAAVFEAPGFRDDMDLPADLMELSRGPSDTRTAAFVRERLG